MRRFSTRKIALAAVVAAMYTVTCYFEGVFCPIFGGIQFRVPEALTVLPFLFPETVWGLFVGCILTNLLSMYGPIDVIFGSLATLLAGLWTSRCRSKWTAPIPPVVCNGVIVSAVIAYAEAGSWSAFPSLWLYNALTVGGSEAVICFVFGLTLLEALERTGAAKRLKCAT